MSGKESEDRLVKVCNELLPRLTMEKKERLLCYLEGILVMLERRDLPEGGSDRQRPLPFG